MQLGSRPGSILPQPSENKNRVKILHNYLGYTKEVDDIYYNMAGYRLHGYTIIKGKGPSLGTTPNMGILPHSEWGASSVGGTVLWCHRSEYPYPNGFLRVLLLTTQLLSCAPLVLYLGLESG